MMGLSKGILSSSYDNLNLVRGSSGDEFWTKKITHVGIEGALVNPIYLHRTCMTSIKFVFVQFDLNLVIFIQQ